MSYIILIVDVLLIKYLLECPVRYRGMAPMGVERDLVQVSSQPPQFLAAINGVESNKYAI